MIQREIGLWRGGVGECSHGRGVKARFLAGCFFVLFFAYYILKLDFSTFDSSS